jgi:uncharacterized protein (DUF952 family)
MTSIIYHLVPKNYWEAQPTDQPYTPAGYEGEGFIHCTKGEQHLLVVANRYYRNVPGEWLVLVLDEQAVLSEIRYEAGNDEVLYPHIYGALNRDAIREVRRMPRSADGAFKMWPPI